MTGPADRVAHRGTDLAADVRRILSTHGRVTFLTSANAELCTVASLPAVPQTLPNEESVTAVAERRTTPTPITQQAER